MSTVTPTTSFDAPPGPIHRFTVAEYHQLGEMGVLTPEDRVELLEGWIVEKMNQRPAHGFAVRLLNDWFQSNLAKRWLTQCQVPLTTDRSEPEPDIAVVVGEHNDCRHRHPSGSDCRLVIEVAESSLTRDRAMAAIYAAADVPEFWIVNLLEKQVEVFRNAKGSIYQGTKICRASESIEFLVGKQALRLPSSEIFAD